jgi:hypothetical protein
LADAPYNLDADTSSLLSTGIRPQILTGVFVRLLARKFAIPEGIHDPRLRGYIWDKDARSSRILIVPVHAWHADVAQTRPALVVKRNRLAPRQIGLRDGAAVPGWNTNQVPANMETQTMAMEGSHTIFAIARSSAEAELLGTEIYIDLVHFGQVIRRDLGLHRFRISEVGPVSILEEEKEAFAVPVTAAYSYVDDWSVIAETPLFKGLILRTEVS